MSQRICYYFLLNLNPQKVEEGSGTPGFRIRSINLIYLQYEDEEGRERKEVKLMEKPGIIRNSFLLFTPTFL
jgi:hypothetical protein